MVSAISSETLGYTVALGLPELRRKISLLYGKWYNIDLDPSRVVITSGSSAAFILSFISLFEAGDRVGVTEPGYPSYRQILKSLSIPSTLSPQASYVFLSDTMSMFLPR